MTLKLKTTPFTRVSEITIPETFYRRYKTGIEQFDGMFGDGILPGSAFTLTAQAGAGKCHGPDEIIEVFGDDKTINKLKAFLAAKAGR